MHSGGLNRAPNKPQLRRSKNAGTSTGVCCGPRQDQAAVQLHKRPHSPVASARCRLRACCLLWLTGLSCRLKLARHLQLLLLLRCCCWGIYVHDRSSNLLGWCLSSWQEGLLDVSFPWGCLLLPCCWWCNRAGLLGARVDIQGSFCVTISSCIGRCCCLWIHLH